MSYKSLIADSELESLYFERTLIKDLGTDSFLQLPENIKLKIEHSWEKIFDMGFDKEYFTSPFKGKKIQATFWELNIDEIIKVDKFRAR